MNWERSPSQFIKLIATKNYMLQLPLPVLQDPQAEADPLNGLLGSIVKPMGVMSTVTPPTCSKRSAAIQKLKPSLSIVLSFSVGSSRAKDKRGPRQPPGAKKIRIPVLGLSAKNASSSVRAASERLIICPPILDYVLDFQLILVLK